MEDANLPLECPAGCRGMNGKGSRASQRKRESHEVERLAPLGSVLPTRNYEAPNFKSLYTPSADSLQSFRHRTENPIGL